jgi:hypothetical protein
MLKEFDNLMRSDSTMKVSLTPDRLKTMEVRHQCISDHLSQSAVFFTPGVQTRERSARESSAPSGLWQRRPL